MANVKVSALTELVGASLAPETDSLAVSDMSARLTKRMTPANFMRAAFHNLSSVYDFTTGSLGPWVSFTRASSAWYRDSAGAIAAALANVPRFQYDPTTLTPRGLLIEEAATNSIRNSTMQGAVAGTPGTLPTNWNFNPTGGLTQSVVGVGTTNGIPYIDYRYQGTSTDAGGSNQYLETTTQIVAALSQNWTISAYVALVAGSLSGGVTMKLGAVQRTSAGGAATGGGGSSNLDGSAFSPTSTLTRYSATVSLNSSDVAYVQPKFFFVYTSGAAIDFTIRIGLPQMVQANMVSSPIKTTGAAASRASDIPAIVNPQALADQCFIIKARTAPALPIGSNVQMLFCVDNGGTANRRCVWRGSDGIVRVVATVGAAGTVFLNMGVVANDTDFSLAVRYANANCAASLNGGPVVADLVGLMPLGLTTVRVGHDLAGRYWNSTIKTFETRRTATNAELQSLSV